MVDLERTQGSLAEKQNEAKDFKAKEVELEEKVEELKEELKSIKAFTRLTTKAAIMRRHLAGKNPLANASEELELYLSSVGNERDLNSEDDKDEEGLEVGDEPSQGEASAEDPPQP
ncbi:hypothetical protein L6452_08756 [Arctium lappa]|uniref:Uncharacterized protein n=1 Tax=Arctium lappa TaxID=4217 RepID=A0ACB9DIZ7_ARCLA|nr:hypothetical protein L6452_08756 [Arctium lappa]